MRNFRRVLLVCLLCLMLLPVSALCEDGVAMGGSEVKEPEVRWTYGVSLTALQSPYLILVNEQNPLDKHLRALPSGEDDQRQAGHLRHHLPAGGLRQGDRENVRRRAGGAGIRLRHR